MIEAFTPYWLVENLFARTDAYVAEAVRRSGEEPVLGCYCCPDQVAARRLANVGAVLGGPLRRVPCPAGCEPDTTETLLRAHGVSGSTMPTTSTAGLG